MIKDNMLNRARKAINFLSDHPALKFREQNIVGKAIFFSIQDVCRRGFDEIVDHMGVDIWYGPKYAKKFEKEFDEAFKKEVRADLEHDPKIPKIEKKYIQITVPYEKLYGKPWKYYRTEYWGEISFYIYHGDPKNEIKDKNQYSWQAYGTGLSVGSGSFEGMVINLAKKFKKRFGNFKSDDFLTKTEKKNHDNEKFASFRECKDSSDHLLEINPKYIRVEEAELNHRWAKWWISNSEFAKKFDIEEIVNKKW